MIRYIRRKYNLLIGEQTAEKAKIAVGSVYERPEDITYVVKGRDLIKGLPKAITITANETIEAFADTTSHILTAIHGVLETAPPELVAQRLFSIVQLPTQSIRCYMEFARVIFLYFLRLNCLEHIQIIR